MRISLLKNIKRYKLANQIALYGVILFSLSTGAFGFMALFCSKTITLKLSYIFLSILGLVSTFALASECSVNKEGGDN